MDLLRNLRADICTCIIFLSCLALDGAPSQTAPHGTDQCSPNPCTNRAICRSRGDGYSCFCVPGFQGEHCQLEVNECVSVPCRNGATCVDGVGRYSCVCAPGFTGATCEVQIDECQSQPCLNGGSCRDYTNNFTCTCRPGFRGNICEIDVDECQDKPCQNGALCMDWVNGYSCDCSQTSFTGPNCETPVPPCVSRPCLNSATCKEHDGNYTCDCWPGFEGRQCELDVNECGSSPCMHEGLCIELSWQALYEAQPLLPPTYDHHQYAAGFECSCLSGTTGALCEEIIDQCESNLCQHGGVCESTVGGYVCRCLQQSQDGVLYGGRYCAKELVGCKGNECQNEGSCSPFLIDGMHGYSCACPAAFTGHLCQIPTAFSFERSGYLLYQSPLVAADASCNITLSFRTVLPRAVLFQWSGGELLLRLELEAGKLRLTLTLEDSRDEGEAEPPKQTLELPHNVTDGEWHSVAAVLGGGLLRLQLLDDGGLCEGQGCEAEAPLHSSLAEVQPLATVPQNTFIGGAMEGPNGPAGETLAPAFIGCLRDVLVDSQLVVPGEWLSHLAVNVTPGCSHRDRCLDNPCQNRGHCTNLWQSYQCRCPRPYEGQDCSEEYMTARFGSEDSPSYAVFTVSDDPGPAISVSLFLRTRQPRGLLLVLANTTSQYLRVWLDEGRVKVQLHDSESLTGESVISDGDIHFVSVVVRGGGRLVLAVSAQRQGVLEVRSIRAQPGDVVHVGGLANQTEASAYGGSFKGCIQDLRVNDRRLLFFGLEAPVKSYPLELMHNVTAGCTGDRICSRNPCLNGGLCYSMWDDFTCSCPPHTAGRHCEDVKWCELSPCPRGAECLLVNKGYECDSNATFLEGSSVLAFRGNGFISRVLGSLSLSLRTRKRHAAILHAEKGPEFVTLSVQDGLLFLELQSGQGSSPVSLASRRNVSDGEWHSAHLFMATPWVPTSQWTLVLDEETEEASTSEAEGGNLDFLREGVDILLGGLGLEAGWNLAGCLGTVEVGGVALPYFNATEVNLPRVQQEQFVRHSPSPPLSGCRGSSVCEPDPCRNGGECLDLFNMFNCSCVEGWAGRHCDFFTDTCAADPCVHGNCSVNGRTYECACEFGYAGADCEEEVDVCERHMCANGATCLHGIDKYACLCAENYTGPYCYDRIEEMPWYIVVRNVRPKLPVSVCGDGIRNYTCFNGGNCSDRHLTCDCVPGFMGHRCEQELDECRSNPCLNGGYCRNLINKFLCVCDMSFAGDVCQIDLTSDPQASLSDLLLSVSVASMVLLLALVLTSVGLVMALNRRANHGTYSPSRQEKEGSRVEMWNIAQPPPTERLI
ncbi:LOW QUALITY PROTEIN: protein crumbs homolog 1 [Aplochiton taeniatus]